MQFFLPNVRKSHDHTQKPKTILLLKNLSSLQRTFWRHKLHFCSRLLKLFAKIQKNSTLKFRKHMKKVSINWSNFYLVKRHALLKVLSKNTIKKFVSSAKGLKLSNKIGSFTLKQTAPITVLWSRRMPV